MPTTRAQKRTPRGDTLVVCDDDDTLLLVPLPDDFDMAAVTGGLCGVLSRRPCPLVILVTAVRQHIEPRGPRSSIQSLSSTLQSRSGAGRSSILRNREACET
jgi:hypothetical protein